MVRRLADVIRVVELLYERDNLVRLIFGVVSPPAAVAVGFGN